ncbi:MAG: DUF1016 N-terminal domain-containing protein [Methylococcales bacterium]|nr:DUF1016 N-terminal domain-containing protein [Methylococcales bacterium]
MRMMSFTSLIETIQQTHLSFRDQSVKAVNIGLTLRNWLIGFYIVEFEQNGDDRAKYGTSLIANLAKSIKIKGLTAPELSRCRQFYKVYPEMIGSLSQTFASDSESNKILPITTEQNFGLTTQKLLGIENNLINSIEKVRLFVSKYKLNLPFEQELKRGSHE